ncbi:ATP-binding protein [Streptomyces sp. NPDC001851]|uniref:ATP-binding protein n=1 Tax=Streptomyces sp. NPDC001851 TaxID=3154529 RepID=UPI003323D86C
MKHSAVRTLGVAALGAAFAAVGAGAAHAAPAVPDTAPALDGVTRTLPAGNVGTAQPGTADALTRGQDALGAGVAAAQPAVESALRQGATAPVHSRLGGLPVQDLPTHSLPTRGLPVDGVSLG